MKKTTTHPPPSRLKGGPQLPKSLRKYIRKEKARIRREVLDLKGQERLIQELYKKISKNYENKRDIQTGDK